MPVIGQYMRLLEPITYNFNTEPARISWYTRGDMSRIFFNRLELVIGDLLSFPVGTVFKIFNYRLLNSNCDGIKVHIPVKVNTKEVLKQIRPRHVKDKVWLPLDIFQGVDIELFSF